ncbi:MAG: nucleotidyltransferase domain-containing protein [Alphaproteobacteria bacterium]|nr:nucleotidyltransferase domain-containing protein [Alphaproteobacteria bacterium]
MDRDTTIDLLRRHEGELRRMGIERLYLFGSTARDSATAASDIDLFFDHAHGRLSLYQLLDIKNRTAAILGSRVDIMSRNSLHPVLRSQIEASARAVF